MHCPSEEPPMKITQLRHLDPTAASLTSVRGTAAQDALVEDGGAANRRRYLQRSAVAAGAVLLLAAFVWLAHAWSNSSHTVSAARLRIVPK